MSRDVVISNPLYAENGVYDDVNFMEHDQDDGQNQEEEGGYLDVHPDALEEEASGDVVTPMRQNSLPRSSFSSPFQSSFHMTGTAAKPAPEEKKAASYRWHNVIIAVMAVIALGAIVAVVLSNNKSADCSATTSGSTTGASTNTKSAGVTTAKKAVPLCPPGTNSSAACPEVSVSTTHWCKGSVKVDSPSTSKVTGMSSLDEHCPRQTVFDLSTVTDLASMGLTYSCEGGAIYVSFFTQSGFEHHIMLSCTNGGKRRRRNTRIQADLDLSKATPPVNPTDTIERMEVAGFGDMNIFDMTPVLKSAACRPQGQMARCGGYPSAPWGECAVLANGGYQCTCKDGFSLSADGSTCEDVNECQSNNGGCTKVCLNSIGGFQCSCGDGVVSAAYNEDCDGGIGCSAECTCPCGTEPDGSNGCRDQCGNGKIDDGENCDAADTNCVDCQCAPGYEPSSQNDGTCTMTCGNGKLDHGELCDDGSEACKDDCTCAFGTIPDDKGGCTNPCGDGVVQSIYFELCDDSSPHCNNCTCVHGYEPDEKGGCQALCGNNVWEISNNEECDADDDSNCVNCKCADGYESTNSDGRCQPICGNGVVDMQETCDKAADPNCENCHCKFGFLPSGDGGCSHPCNDGSGGEEHGVFCKLGEENCINCQCTEGFLPDGNGACEASCGNGKVDADEGENCDSADPNCKFCKCATGYEPKKDGSGECQPFCGNGIMDPFEECDNTDKTCVSCSCAHGYISDGNGGCAKLCGNGVFQPEYSEECDSPQGSCVNCRCAAGTLPDNNGACELACGNGAIDTKFGEECDKPGDSLCTGCMCEAGSEKDPDSTGCRKLCGNLHLDASVNENCDDGSSSCINCRCKDGFLPDGQGGCETANVCGNGKLDPNYGEECDDTSDTKCVNCQCAFQYRGDGQGKCIAECGDGQVNPLLGEQCDSDDTDCYQCKCKRGTEPDTDKGCRPICGNGFVDPDETCDNKDDANCISCQCKAPTFISDGITGCTSCGNGQWDKGIEECDSQQSTCVKCKCATGFETDLFGGCRKKCTCDESVTTACYNCQCAEGFVPTGDGGCNPLCGNGKIDDNGLEECDNNADPNCVNCQCTTSPLDQGNGCKEKPKMVSDTQFAQINSWAGISTSTKWQQCYSATTGSLSPSAWFAGCDNKGPVIFVTKTNTGKTIGAYMPDIRWSSGYYTTSPAPFLFSLTTNYRHAYYRYSYQYYTSSSYGPTFGGGHDLHINGAGTSGYCNIGHTYQCRTSSYGSSTCRNDFCGTTGNFQPTEMEFYVQGSGGGGTTTPKALVSADDWSQINEWVGFVNSTTWLTCFKSTSGDVNTFHANCDGKGDLVTVALLNAGQSNERLVGGYQSISASNVGYYADPKAFLFSLTNKRQYKQYQNQQNALSLSSGSFPTFGGGHDFYLGPSTPYCNLGSVYECAAGAYGSTSCRDEFCGTYNPAVKEFQVFYRPFAPVPIIALPEEIAQVNEWAGYKKDTKWELCFRKSELHHGNAFKDRCGNRGPTITIALLNAGADGLERRIGGYADKSFGGVTGYQNSANSFLFSLTNKHTYPIFRNYNNALYWTTSSGGYPPTFGGGHDLFLGTDPNNARCNLGHTYQCHIGVQGTTQCQEEFCGLYQPRVNDYEVFILEHNENTVLASADQIKKINGYIGIDAGTKWKVCYRRSHHGDLYPSFAEHCMGKGETVTLAYLNGGTDQERLIGGYTSQDLKSSGGYYSDDKAFLFSVTNDHKYLQYQYQQYAMYGNNNYFPTFGYGHDLYLGGGTPSCNLGRTYRCATSSYGSAACRDEFCGTYNPKITDMEVWVRA